MVALPAEWTRKPARLASNVWCDSTLSPLRGSGRSEPRPGTLREQLGIESLALVSLVVRLGDELGVDVVESGVELGGTKTVADLVKVADALSHS